MANSIYRSAVFEPSSVHPLLVVPAGAEKVSVVTWTGKQTAEKFYPLGETAVGVDVWVTLAPQVRRLCETYPSAPDALRLRLQQLLGLPAKDEERVFVEMQARVSDIFRPCPDPDPTKADVRQRVPRERRCQPQGVAGRTGAAALSDGAAGLSVDPPRLHLRLEPGLAPVWGVRVRGAQGLQSDRHGKTADGGLLSAAAKLSSVTTTVRPRSRTPSFRWLRP